MSRAMPIIKGRILDYCSTFLFVIPIIAWYWSAQQLQRVEHADYRVIGSVAQRGQAEKRSSHKFKVTGTFVEILHSKQVERFWLECNARRLIEQLDVGDEIEVVATGPGGLVCELSKGATVLLTRTEFLADYQRQRGWFWSKLIPILGFASICFWPLVLASIYWDGRKSDSVSGKTTKKVQDC